MKKRIVTLCLILCLFIGICYYISLPDYQILSSMSFSDKSSRDTTLKVVVYKYWGIDKTIKDIEAEHNGINGTPTTLKMNLYYSAKFIRYGEQPFKTVEMKYDKTKE